MSVTVIYLVLLQNIFPALTSKVNVINISEWNGDVSQTSVIRDQKEKKVIIGLLLPRNIPHPDDPAYFSRLDSVLPGVVLATQDLNNVLPGWSWDILVGDTDCNSTTGPLKAVDMFYK